MSAPASKARSAARADMAVAATPTPTTSGVVILPVDSRDAASVYESRSRRPRSRTFMGCKWLPPIAVRAQCCPPTSDVSSATSWQVGPAQSDPVRVGTSDIGEIFFLRPLSPSRRE